MTPASSAPRDSGSRPRAYDMTKRTAGAASTRRRIAEAALDLFMEHDYDTVSLKEIAKAAGVSHQTLLNHCENKAGVLLAAGEVFSEQVTALEVSAVPGDVASIVRATCIRYEALGDANARWSAMRTRSPEVAEGLERGRRNFQIWLEEMFDELMPSGDDSDERKRVLIGLHAALDVFTWRLLRRELGLSQERTEQQLTDLVLGVLARHRT